MEEAGAEDYAQAEGPGEEGVSQTSSTAYALLRQRLGAAAGGRARR